LEKSNNSTKAGDKVYEKVFLEEGHMPDGGLLWFGAVTVLIVALLIIFLIPRKKDTDRRPD
jgi:hypothetical protein